MVCEISHNCCSCDTGPSPSSCFKCFSFCCSNMHLCYSCDSWPTPSSSFISYLKDGPVMFKFINTSKLSINCLLLHYCCCANNESFISYISLLVVLSCWYFFYINCFLFFFWVGWRDGKIELHQWIPIYSRFWQLTEAFDSFIHETGLCKNVLQGYALKMKYGTPSYNCQMEEKRGVAVFSCTVEVGGSKFIGSAARTKKEAEISAARIALSAIQASVSGPSDAGTSAYTVVPRKKRATGSGISTQETVLKPKKVSLKKKQRRKRQRGREGTNLNVGGMGNSDASIDHVGGAAEDGTLTAREFYGGSSQS
ncbi:uncharacterized protein LOC127798675 isoform X2 [Diospyros lotus]|uniref:uncharacterized protein LOC127798675 isoform X2 n=1 Tax=Diospyros lotus TaxID=55363 RepID=UPI002250F729|nr:uncharacterized protein LOC127798675 isoform X2 [Diospyros lotus]